MKVVDPIAMQNPADVAVKLTPASDSHGNAAHRHRSYHLPHGLYGRHRWNALAEFCEKLNRRVLKPDGDNRPGTCKPK